MKGDTNGFSLIECLIYLALVALVLVLTMHWLLASQRRVSAHHAIGAASLTVQVAFDLIAKDLMQAVNQNPFWKEHNNGLYVWSIRDCDIGWELKGERLIRSQGMYDGVSKSWRQVTQALIAERIDELTLFQSDVPAQVINCIIRSKDTQVPLQSFIAIRSRILA